MKIIFSRKGFDSSTGKVPSPIFEDGKFFSLPIPDKKSGIKYKDLKWYQSLELGDFIEKITEKKINKEYFAHLDPDLNSSTLPRKNGWKPIFGQAGSAQGHLINQGISKGDIFLFFGLFKKIICQENNFLFKTNSFPIHLIFGWLQIEEINTVDETTSKKFEWASYHPHLYHSERINNTIYIAKKYLNFGNLNRKKINGGGCFDCFSKKLQLTATKSKKPSYWCLPELFYPIDKQSTLSYHGDISKWQRDNNNNCVYLNTASRGQEFVLNVDHYPESTEWLENIFSDF